MLGCGKNSDKVSLPEFRNHPLGSIFVPGDNCRRLSDGKGKSIYVELINEPNLQGEATYFCIGKNLECVDFAYTSPDAESMVESVVQKAGVKASAFVDGYYEWHMTNGRIILGTKKLTYISNRFSDLLSQEKSSEVGQTTEAL